MTNICFLLGGFQGNGGIGRVVSILSNAFCETADFSVSAISFCHKDGPNLYKVNQAVKQFSLYSENISMTKAMLKSHAVHKVKSIIREQKIDILIACGVLYYPLGILAVRGTKAKCFCWEHISPTVSSDYRFQSVCRKFGVRFADKLIVLTKSAEYYYERLHVKSDKVVQIYNPVVDRSEDVVYDQHSQKIISVGRLSYQKNFELLLDIAAIVIPRHSNWTWDIYGEGELHQSLVQKAEALGISDRVRFMGMVDDLYNHYDSYSFMVMTSRYEGFPMTLLEGITHGLPLISFDVPTGPSEIIDHNVNGYLIHPGNQDEMIKAIEDLIEHPETRKDFSQASLRIKEHFAIGSILEKWRQILTL